MSEHHHEKRAVIIDDSSAVRRLISGMLRDIGFRSLMEAADGAEGIQLLRDLASRNLHVDLCTLDVEMPCMDGMGFLHMAGMPDFGAPRPPIILVTGHATKEIVAKAAAMGVQGILPKPFTAQALKGAAERILRPKAKPHHAAHPHPHNHGAHVARH